LLKFKSYYCVCVCVWCSVRVYLTRGDRSAWLSCGRKRCVTRCVIRIKEKNIIIIISSRALYRVVSVAPVAHASRSFSFSPKRPRARELLFLFAASGKAHTESRVSAISAIFAATGRRPLFVNSFSIYFFFHSVRVMCFRRNFDLTHGNYIIPK